MLLADTIRHTNIPAWINDLRRELERCHDLLDKIHSWILQFCRRRATQTHITTLKWVSLILALQVAWRIPSRIGANLETSELKLSQEKVLIHWDHRVWEWNLHRQSRTSLSRHAPSFPLASECVFEQHDPSCTQPL